jgi:hypothetical protein
MNINIRNPELNKILKDRNFTTKIYLYMATKSAGVDFDPEEKNYTYTLQNPHVVKAYIRDIRGEALVWKQYGLAETGSKEAIVEYKYVEWFRLAHKIVIDNDEFQVYKENVGNRMLIEKRPFALARIILQKVK